MGGINFAWKKLSETGPPHFPAFRVSLAEYQACMDEGRIYGNPKESSLIFHGV
jgi:hypothetical protein